MPATMLDFEGHRLKLAGDLNFAAVPAVWRAMRRHLQRSAPPRIIDLSAVRQADSSALALLVEWCAQASRGKRELTISDVPPTLITLAKLNGFDHLLNLQPRATDD